MGVNDFEGLSSRLGGLPRSSVLAVVEVAVVFELKAGEVELIEQMGDLLLFLHLNLPIIISSHHFLKNRRYRKKRIPRMTAILTPFLSGCSLGFTLTARLA